MLTCREIEKWSQIEENIWHQKSRVDWISLGDSNTRFFHAFARARQSGKAITQLIREDGTKCVTQAQIIEEIKSFYTRLMGSAAPCMPMLDKQIVRRGKLLKHSQQVLLCAEFTDQEITNALFQMNSQKSPGVDGFNVLFFKKAWTVIGSEVIAAIKQFHLTGFLPKNINTALIVLLPKTPSACSIKEYRPIACCTVLYKILSNVLANRMQGVLDEIIGVSQSAFVKGRLISDNILMTHELVKGYNRRGISPRCMVKIDIQKAYDSVEWPFLKYLMLELGFPFMFVNWIMQCISTVSYSICINGEVTEPFEARKGLRQGDPISPYLFVICMEYLHRSLLGLKTNKEFHFHPRCKKFGIVQMCFADDLLLFARGDVGSVKQLMASFNHFSEVSGLKANEAKSSIYFGGVDMVQQEVILNTFGMLKGELPFKYLGVPLSPKKLTVIQCQPLVDKILARINCWASKLLTYAGRMQLIKAVLFSVQIYWGQIFLIPQKIIKIIQTACRTFLWTESAGTSRRALVAWEYVCLPKTAGGWNVVNMKLWNQAALCKLLWNIMHSKEKLWIQWVHGYYIKGRDLSVMDIPTQASWVMKKIMGAREYVRNSAAGQDLLQQANFSIKKMYHVLRGNVVKVSWNKMLCSNDAPPKCVFITWLNILGRLATCDNLMKFGIHVDPLCSLCGLENESRNHLFFLCEFSAEVWTRIKTWCGLQGGADDWDKEMDKLNRNCGSKTSNQRIYRLILSVVVYGLWQERNYRRFQEKRSTVENVIRQCQLLTAIRCRRDARLAKLLQT